MSPSKEETLVHDYPLTFGKNTIGPMWGLEICDGWFAIIDALFSRFEAHNKNTTLKNRVVLSQVKEKFGALRVYVDDCDDPFPSWMNDEIAKAEELSRKTCENCGDPGELRGGSWLKTLCDPCRSTRGV